MSIPIFGIVLTAGGTILLLNTFDVLRWAVWLDMWRLWPVLLVLLGLKFLFPPFHPLLMLLISGAVVGGVIGFAFAVSEGEIFEANFTTFIYQQERGNSDTLDLRIEFGAGTVRIQPLPDAGPRLLAAEFFDDEGDVDISSSTNGTERRISIKLGRDSIPFISRSGDDRTWTILINPRIGTSLNIDGGAGKFVLDLTDTQVVSFDADIGAADLDVFAPVNAGRVRGSISAGAADISVSVPAGMPARIDNESGISSVDIDSLRFPKSDGVHESAGYDSAVNRLELEIRAGASSIKVK